MTFELGDFYRLHGRLEIFSSRTPGYGKEAPSDAILVETGLAVDLSHGWMLLETGEAVSVSFLGGTPGQAGFIGYGCELPLSYYLEPAVILPVTRKSFYCDAETIDVSVSADGELSVAFFEGGKCVAWLLDDSAAAILEGGSRLLSQEVHLLQGKPRIGSFELPWNDMAVAGLEKAVDTWNSLPSPGILQIAPRAVGPGHQMAPFAGNY